MVFANHEKKLVYSIASLLDKMSKTENAENMIQYKKVLLGATKIEDLAGEPKNSTFFSVAPPSLILCAKVDTIG